MSVVAALYIDPLGPYPKMVGVDCWDERRDARSYAGPWPVVAHPPCTHYGRLRHLAKRDDADCGPIAVAQVRAYGGVLEHPAHSKLWEACGMPKPGELPDAFGGIAIRVDQVRWGHPARKPTWVYAVGILDFGGLPPAREPTHWCSGGGSGRGKAPPGIRVCSAQQRRRTPPAFAEWLVSLARSVRKEAA